MSYYLTEYERQGRMLPSYLPHLKHLISAIDSNFPHIAEPTLVELGAGSGEIVSFLADSKPMKCLAIDMSPNAFANLSPNVTPLRTTISKAKIRGPVHVIHAKDLTDNMCEFERLLKTIEPWVIHNTLFMLTYFIDSLDAWKTNDRARRAGWNKIRESSWTPTSEEVYKDWYPAFPATRNVVIFQKVSNK